MKNAVWILVLALMSVSGPAQEIQDLADEEIDTAIETALWSDDAVTANEIRVAVTDGIVTMIGTVNSILAKERAEEIVAATVGVRAIVNQVTVEPAPGRGDGELTEAVENAWLRDPAVHAWKLTAAADDGEVTLSGTVDSFAKKELAATVAKGVRGVVAVENDIEVDQELDRPGAEMRTEIQARIENDIRIDDALVEVFVVDGHVRLSGTVGSLTEKERTRELARVSGVRTVDTEELNIDWRVRDDMRHREALLELDDEVIQLNVEDALAHDPRVELFDIDVWVRDQSVRLRGEVDNLAAKSAAEQTARNTMGVRSVQNYIHVRTDVPPDDELKYRVETALIDDPLIDRYDLDVSAESGWVYLSGDVNTSAQKERAGSVAERQTGVRGVVNSIDHDYTWFRKPDWEIVRDVNNRLKWNPFVNESAVDVSVDDGVVALTGTVYSRSEKNEAEKSAFQGGARNVKNDLDVEILSYGPYSPNYYGATHLYGPAF